MAVGFGTWKGKTYQMLPFGGIHVFDEKPLSREEILKKMDDLSK
jgi:hypothetical protein